jgi:hypothetical protein
MMSRTGILEKAGFRLIHTHLMKDAAARIATKQFDVVILRHSVETAERRRLAGWLRVHQPLVPICWSRGQERESRQKMASMRDRFCAPLPDRQHAVHRCLGVFAEGREVPQRIPASPPAVQAPQRRPHA